MSWIRCKYFKQPEMWKWTDKTRKWAFSSSHIRWATSSRLFFTLFSSLNNKTQILTARLVCCLKKRTTISSSWFGNMVWGSSIFQDTPYFSWFAQITQTEIIWIYWTLIYLYIWWLATRKKQRRTWPRENAQVNSICLPSGSVRSGFRVHKWSEKKRAQNTSISEWRCTNERTTHTHSQQQKATIHNTKLKIDLNYSDFRGEFHRKR